VTSGRYSDVLRNQLKPAIRRQRRGLSSSCVRLQGVNARAHTARHTVKRMQDFKLQVLPCPPHSPDLAPNDFHLFWPLKDALFGRNLRSETYSLLVQGGIDIDIVNKYGMWETWRGIRTTTFTGSIVRAKRWCNRAEQDATPMYRT